jgi:hypothetical protein
MLTTLEKYEITNCVIRKLGTRRAREAKRTPDQGVLTNGQNTPNPTGFDGVDPIGRKFRARIRYCDALSGQDTRLTIGTFDSAESAGFAYCQAHILLWGVASRYASEEL